MRKADPIGLAKAILWEEAKGKLRALIAADGAEMERPGGPPEPGVAFHFELLEAKIDAFIADFEGEGLHE